MKHKGLWLAMLLAVGFGLASASGESAAQQAKQSLGTWENKDEDGDGVPDEQDDYPFDASKSQYELRTEQEFNNNVAQANRVGRVPFRVQGVISESRDIDDFKFTVSSEDITARAIFSFILYKDDPKFKPAMVIIKDNGSVLQAPRLAIDVVGRIGYAISFKPDNAGTYNISVTDFNGNNDVDFTYSLESFVDEDVDGVADELEVALAMDPRIQDTDRDDILDGNEFHVFKSHTYSVSSGIRDLDVDLDNIPNWLDTDSDDDGIADLLESTANFDSDNYPNFVDVDSDNNSIDDKNDFDTSIGYSQDTDGDNIPDYADVDDDGDLLLDIHDVESKNALLTFDMWDAASPRIRNIQLNMNGSDVINKFYAAHTVMINGLNLNVSNEAFVVLNKYDNNGKITNLKVNVTSANQIEFVVPDYGDIAFGGEDVDVFVAFGGKKTETIRVRLLDPLTPKLHAITPISVVSGQVVSVIGEHLSPGTKVIINDRAVQLKILSAKKAEFIVPKSANAANIFLENQYGKSESSSLNMTKHQNVVIDIPAKYHNMTGPFTLSMVEGAFVELADIQGYAYPVNRSKPDTLLIQNANNSSILRAISLPSESDVYVSMESTIKAMALTSFIRGKTESQVIEALALLPQLSSYLSLKEYVLSGINTDIDTTFDLGNMAIAAKIYDVNEELERLLAKKVK